MFYVEVSVFYNPVLLFGLLDYKLYEAKLRFYLPAPGLNEWPIKWGGAN